MHFVVSLLVVLVLACVLLAVFQRFTRIGPFGLGQEQVLKTLRWGYDLVRKISFLV